MSGEWWTRAYPGGPMVGPPLKRALYPPDSKSQGKTPSTDGDDVVALKRGLWRGGRWQRPEAGFDGAFSNGFQPWQEAATSASRASRASSGR